MTQKTFKITKVCIEAAEALTVGILPIALDDKVLAGAIDTLVVAIGEAVVVFLSKLVKE